MVAMTEKYRSSTEHGGDYHFSRRLGSSFSPVVQKSVGGFPCRGVNPLSLADDLSLITDPTLGHWIISETQNISETLATSFFGYDGHNSVRFLTNASGVVTDNYTSDAFGVKIAGAGTTPNQILYGGEYLDPGTGNYELRARVYDQNTGTFLTRDTYAGQLPYVYPSDNPVMFVDPSGHDGDLASLNVSIDISTAIDSATANLSAGAITEAGNVAVGAETEQISELVDEAKTIAEDQATTGAKFDVIGNFPGYINVARTLGAVFFNLSDEMFAVAGQVANQTSIRAAISAGVTFILSTPPEEAGAGTQMEIQILLDAGYTYVETGLGITLQRTSGL